MRKTFHLTRSATVAIAAALALGSTSIVAQSADPAATPADTVVIPPPATVVPPAPVASVPAAVAPAYTPPPTQVSQPVVQPVPTPPVITPPPVAAQATARPAATRPAASTAAKRSTAPAPAPAASAPAPEPVASPSEAAEILPPAPIVANPPAAAAEQVQTVRSPMLLNLIVLGGLLILVLAVLAVLYRRIVRRNRAEKVAPIERSSRPVAVPRAEPVPQVSTMPPEIAAVAAPAVAEPVRTEPTPIRRDMASPMRRPTTPGALPSAGAAVDLPARLPEDYEERSALLRRMIEARPDKANPFTNRKSRAKRARLILQSLGRKFEDADPWIDLSQYPNNWPELARRYSQAA